MTWLYFQEPRLYDHLEKWAESSPRLPFVLRPALLASCVSSTSSQLSASSSRPECPLLTRVCRMHIPSMLVMYPTCARILTRSSRSPVPYSSMMMLAKSVSPKSPLSQPISSILTLRMILTDPVFVSRTSPSSWRLTQSPYLLSQFLEAECKKLLIS